MRIPRSEVPGPGYSISYEIVNLADYVFIPTQTSLAGKNPIVASTHIAHVVILYTKARGK